MAAMAALVDSGKVRFIGVSNFSVPELKKAQAALSKYRIVSNQVRYSLVERSIELQLLRYCQANQITVIAYSPLARGQRHIKEKDPHNVLGTVAARIGKTEAQVALNWCLAKPGVIAIPKSNSLAYVRENCNASGWRLPPQDIKLLDTSIAFRRRGRLESALRRTGRCSLQKLGYRQ
jgi:diketogulonate reductase-like aldo/keto reductase